jgi:sugar phosphate isomerase/epimerase
MTSSPLYDRDSWPIAAAMIPWPNRLPDGRTAEEQSAEEWADTLMEVADAGFTEFDPTDCWLAVADLSPIRRREFAAVAKSVGLTIPAISSFRRSITDPAGGLKHLAYSHRVIDAAAEFGSLAVSFGFTGAFTEAQQKALWFWSEPGPAHPDDPELWKLAVLRMRELGRHAAEVGVEIGLEMNDDPFLDSADKAVRFTRDIDLPNVGINADVANLIRMHKQVEHWRSMMEKVAPYMKYWHVKNYLRMEDPRTGTIVSHPTSLELGWINYREAIRIALAHGFNSPFLVEHYGGDGFSITCANRDYLRRILPRRRTH